MAPEVLFVLVALGCFLIAAIGGWLMWGKPLGTTRSELAERREALGRAVAEVAHFKSRFEEAAPSVARAADLAAKVSALSASAEERYRAHGAAITERERVQTEAIAERDKVHARQLEEIRAQFAPLATEALEKAQKQFVEQADETLKFHRSEAEKGVVQSRLAIGELLRPMGETLAKYEVELKRIEEGRVGGYEALRTMLTGLSEEQTRGRQAVTRLETALRSSGKVAGRWGEEQCRNVLEAAGLVEGVDFEVQTSQGREDSSQRPDFVINLPGDRSLVVDVKCSLDAFMSAVESEDIPQREKFLQAHARSVRNHATGLAAKDYSKGMSSAVDFVVMFVPGENFLAAALEQDRSLLNDFFGKRVVLAGPVNLIAVARTVAAMRDQARLAREAAEIAKLGRELYDSLRIMGGNVSSIQKSLDSTVGNFNRFVSQLDSRVMLRARRFHDLGATTGLEQLPELPAIDRLPQPATSSELGPDATSVGDQRQLGNDDPKI